MGSKSSPDRIQPAEGMLPPRRWFFFEKWYLDGQTAGGDFFLTYLAPMALAGKRSAELVLCLFPSNGPAERRSFHLPGREVDLSGDRTSARFGGGALQMGESECRISFRREDAEVDVRYGPLAPPWAPMGHGHVLREGGRALRWVVPLPAARVSGLARVKGTAISLDGVGYCDFVQTDIPPWRLPLRELLWGRALSPDGDALVWNRIGFRGPAGIRRVGLGLCRARGEAREAREVRAEMDGWVDHAATGDRWPGRLEIDLPRDGGPGDRALLDRTRLLLGERVADVQRFGSPLERWLYRAATGDPVEYKLLSRARMEGPAQGEALAAHEWVRWGRGRGARG